MELIFDGQGFSAHFEAHKKRRTSEMARLFCLAVRLYRRGFVLILIIFL